MSYTPEHLNRTLLNLPTAIEGERKQVTVLFCDLADSTVLAERLGPERMHGLLESFFAVAMAEVHRYEGTVNQFLGDGFMALFGAPIAHEDHARRAALAATGIQQAITRQRSEPGATPETSVSVRIGLNSGPVVVGRIGDNLRMDYTAVGDTTNLAARMQQLAEPGAVYLTEATRRLIEPFVETIALGERRVKGKDVSLPVFRLAGVRPAQADQHAQQLGTPLVGRDGELQTLSQAVARVHGGQGGTVWLLGEAGLGKSRLVAEASASAAGRVRWLEGRALSFGSHFSFWPFLEILRAAAGITHDEADAAAAAKLQLLTADLFPEGVEDILPYLSALLGLPIAPDLQHRVSYLDGHALGLQVFRSVKRLFERLAGNGPLTLVFEDLHWADRSSLELLEHLLPLASSLPLLFVIAARPERDGPVDALRAFAKRTLGDRSIAIDLSPLSTTESLVLLNHLVPGEPSARLKQAAVERADGNPFYLEEIVRTVVADGLLAWNASDGRWRVTSDDERIRLPDTLHDVISARIDRLDAEAKQLLKVASVIGRSFLHRVLSAASDAGEKLETFLRALEALELIREKRRVPDLEYVFKHALVQEATYATLLTGRRRELHRRVADCIERLFADRLQDFLGVLAYHYARAEAWEKAQAYLLKAGDQAARIAADTEALDHYQHAIDAYEKAFGNRWDVFERATLERKIGEALFRLGHHERALAHVISAKGRLHSPLTDLPASRWGTRLRIATAASRRVGRALLARVITPPAPAPIDARILDEIARLGEVTGWIDYFLNPERFLLQAIEGLSFFEQHPHAIGLIYNHMSIGLICDAIPLFGVAERHHRQALAIATENGQPIALGHALLGMGIHAHSMGARSDAQDSYARSASIFQEIGHIRGWGGSTMMQAWICEELGDFERGSTHAEALNTAGAESSDPQVHAWGLQRRGAIGRQDGRVAQAIADLERATELCQQIPDYAGVVQSLALLGLCHLDDGDYQSARASVDRANRIRRERQLRGIWVTHVIEAAATIALAELEAATSERGAVLARARRACGEAMTFARAAPYFRPTALRLFGRLRWHEGRRAAAERQWAQSASAAAAIGSAYQQALALTDHGRFLGKRDALESAAAHFKKTGARRELMRVEHLLTSLGARDSPPPARG